MSKIITRRGACALGLATLAAPAALGSSGGSVGGPSKKLTTEQWGIAEIRLLGPQNGNPYTDVSVGATFVLGARRIEVPGFYDGDGIYRIRFCPPETGTWKYLVKSSAPSLNGRTGAVVAVKPGKGNHGPVGVADTFHFAYADGTPFRQIGTTSYGWIHQSDAMCALTLQTLAASPFNKIRMAIFPNGTLVGNEPVYPFEGKPHAWDYGRFNPFFFRRLEQRIASLEKLGIEADIILFHPYDNDKWGFDNMPAEADDRYLRYVVARLSAYRNVWWSMANEYDAMKHKTEADFDRFFQIVQRQDPYGRLRSIHHMRIFYDNCKPWVTHASIQSGALAEDDERAVVLRDIWRKPVILDEVKYEGNHTQRWAQLSGEEMVMRFWYGTVAGEYVGHSEFFEDEAHHVWLGTGGVLRGKSPARLAFLRKVLEEGPKRGLEPIDKWQDHHMGGVAGTYYLKYFGRDAPSEWPFVLPKDGLADGMTFRAEILDTWNMTVTEVPGSFTVKQSGQYDFADAAGRRIALPGKPWIALRLRKV